MVNILNNPKTTRPYSTLKKNDESAKKIGAFKKNKDKIRKKLKDNLK